MESPHHLRPFSPFPAVLQNEHVYLDNRFEGKAEQMAKVANFIREKGFVPDSLIDNEVAWFYSNLGIDDQYFALESYDVIANHIMALYGAKINAFIQNEDRNPSATFNSSFVDINLERESYDKNRAVFIHTSKPGISSAKGPHYERKIDANYLNKSDREKSYRLETYRSLGSVSAASTTQLRCYFVSRCHWVDPSVSEQETDISKVSDVVFLSKATPRTLELYQKIMNNVLRRTGPVIEMFEIEGVRQKRLIVGYRQQTTLNLFSALSDLYHYYGLFTSRKYVEQFANGVTIITLYLNSLIDAHYGGGSGDTESHSDTCIRRNGGGQIQTPDPASPMSPKLPCNGCTKQPPPPIELAVLQIIKETSLIYCLPTTPLQPLFQEARLSVQEAIYGYIALVFSQHFLNRLGSEFVSLASILDQRNASHLDILSKLKKRLRQDTFTREYVLDIVKRYPTLIRALYVNFAMTHYIGTCSDSLQPSLSFQRLHTDRVLSESEIVDLIRKTVANNHEFMVFEAFLTFNKHVLKTNFYLQTKTALSFRLDPSFVPQSEYPIRPYGLFMVVGSEFRGFHLRFSDVARGGVRIIRSRNREAYSINFRSLFDENYSLAATQKRKNKDIPEGGSKGTILLNTDQQEKSFIAFKKYIDSILDLIIRAGKCGGPTNEMIIDLLGQEEIIFLGPDEGTAEYMDWASQHAKERGLPSWKAFTTGKSQSLGGIPHDMFGMTTHSVHQYVLGIYRKLGLNEETVTKFQTGGPDGDLGSNEIKISGDRTTCIVDGSGVLYDPEGLNRAELLRLATARQPIAYFDVALLSKRGFRVLIDDKGVKLPDGLVVDDGLRFRNEFHLSDYAACDLFVPCGGRPEAIDVSNVSLVLKGGGPDQHAPKWKFVVEGANLFFTQEARLALEEAGVIIFKDASANKGGVTSSSFEVLAALALNDEEFSKHMQVGADGGVPEFYKSYVSTVQSVIENNAQMEFEAIWREHKKTGLPRSVISDELSLAIVKLNEEVSSTSLWENKALRRLVLSEAIPKILQDLVGLDTLLQERIPERYQRSLFGSYLASRFVYTHGIQPGLFAFFEFMRRYFELLFKENKEY